MTDKEYKHEKDRIRKLITKWRNPLGLGWWRLEFEYEREEPEYDGKVEYAPVDIDGMWKNMAVTRCDPNYLKGNIVFYLVQTKKLDDEELETVFVHECMHIILSPMHHKLTAGAEEMVATKLAQNFMYTYDVKPAVVRNTLKVTK